MNTEHWIVYSSIQRGNVFISVYIYCVSVKFTIHIHFNIPQNLVENEISLPKRHSSSSILCGWNCYSGIHLNYFTWQAGSGKEWREREGGREREREGLTGSGGDFCYFGHWLALHWLVLQTGATVATQFQPASLYLFIRRLEQTE